MTEPAITVQGLFKSFKLPHQRFTSLKDRLLNMRKRQRGYEMQRALKGVSFEINKGEFFGIVGRNGSGKSTLLKCLAGVYAPEKGKIEVSGTLVPFIELGVGFNPELSGRDNVFLNGALLGFDRRDMRAMYDDIVEFAELEDFMDQKLKNYSSGMQVRLAFSIAIRAQADILLLDEVLAVGDESFQRKCYKYFAELKQERKTVILVTHSMESVQRFCDRAMLLEKGKVVTIGEPSEVTREYQVLNMPKASVPKESKEEEPEKPRSVNELNVDVDMRNGQGTETSVLTGEDKEILFKIRVTPKRDIKNAFFGFTIRKSSGELMYWFTTETKTNQIDRFEKGKPIRIEASIQNVFGEGLYSVNAIIRSNDRSQDYAVYDDLTQFEVVNRGPNGFMLHPQAHWKVER